MSDIRSLTMSQAFNKSTTAPRQVKTTPQDNASHREIESSPKPLVRLALKMVKAHLLSRAKGASQAHYLPIRNDAVKALPLEQPILPIPRSFSFGADKVKLSPEFQIKVQYSLKDQQQRPPSVSAIDKALERCMDRLQLKRNSTVWSSTSSPRNGNPGSNTIANGELRELIIVVDDAVAALVHGMDESYTINISLNSADITVSASAEEDAVFSILNSETKDPQSLDGKVEDDDHRLKSHIHGRQQGDFNANGVAVAKAVLKTGTQWGVLHGLDTFIQLVTASPAPDSGMIEARQEQFKNVLEIPNLPWVITDKPLYGHRGLLLDTSRHYIPVKDILRTIDAMSMVKLNVLHWHVLDQQSYPLVSKAFPELTNKGAERPDYIYSEKGVAQILSFASERGVRVIPEFDMPGHAASWGRSYPNLTVCLDIQPHAQYSAEPPAGQLDPLEPFTYSVLDTLVKEWTAQFPDPLVHAGGDEINFDCWKTSPRLKDYIEHHSSREGYEGALSPVGNLPGPNDPNAMKRTRSGKQSGEDKLLEVFVDRVMEMYLSKGKRPIVWEEVALEHTVNLPKSAIVQVWKNARSTKRVYSYSLTEDLNQDEQKLIYGGEACMWGEQTDSTNLDSSVWPRSAAVAEVLWSGNADDKGEPRPLLDAAHRMSAVRERLVSMSVAAAPIFPSWCGKDLEACLV
ncbi:hypothetical protein BGW38_002550 [Lunasporangiospora selenospora]|uniref:Beta-hexosaminidase n=1 Tax=Lunasporangiospora selenospora TaxID=979761 RepID=A0A9P6KHY3_9FUNG|nr:hypothetical protein BGW38_002550 [Lunasporangiospora selenospora]